MTSRSREPVRRRSKPLAEPALQVLRAGWPSGVALLDEASLVELEMAADDPPAGSLLVLACEYADIATDAGGLIAAEMLGVNSASDFLPMTPISTRWGVADVAALADRVAVYPKSRHVVLLPSADEFERRALDRLLLVLEEPPSPLLVLLCVSRASLLPETIIGRAAKIVELRVLSSAAREAALVEHGVAPAVAAESVALAGVRPSLAGPFAADVRLRELARVALSAADQHSRPVHAAYLRLAALSTLAGLLAAVRRDPLSGVEFRAWDLDEIDQVGRRVLLDLLQVWAAHRRDALVKLLVSGDASVVDRVQEELLALESFHERVATPVPLGLCLSAFTASAALRV